MFQMFDLMESNFANLMVVCYSLAGLKMMKQLSACAYKFFLK